MKAPKVSVVMPVYNTPERLLRPAIESILNQTYKDFEFIIINDGSQDENVERVIASYTDPRIVYLKHKENKGLISGFNTGLKAACGDYIARMDSDDISLPERFAKQVAYMDEHPQTGVLGTWAKTFPEEHLWQPPENFGLMDLLKWNPWLIHPSIMLRSSILRKYDIYYGKHFSDPRAMAEDYDLWWQMILVSEIHNLPEVLFHYRYGEGFNISVWKMDEIIRQTKVIQQKILDFLTKNKDLQDKIWGALWANPNKKVKHKTRKKLKYLLYKAVWILTGKGTFFKKKVEKAKRKMKGLQ